MYELIDNYKSEFNSRLITDNKLVIYSYEYNNQLNFIIHALILLKTKG